MADGVQAVDEDAGDGWGGEHWVGRVEGEFFYAVRGAGDCERRDDVIGGDGALTHGDGLADAMAIGVANDDCAGFIIAGDVIEHAEA